MRYSELVKLYEKLDSTSKRLEKTYYVSELIKETDAEDIKTIVLLVQGKIYPESVDKKIGISSKLVIKAINRSTGISEKKIEQEWKKLGDLGDVAKELLKKKQQMSLFQKDMNVEDILTNMRKLSEAEGQGSVDLKLNIISDMLISSSPEEAKYIVRTLVDNLRLGLGRSSLRDALIWAYFSDQLNLKYNFEKNDIELNEEERTRYNEIVEKVQHAYDLTNNLGKVALVIKKQGIEGIEKLKIELGNPINPMLYTKAKDVDEAFEIVGKPAAFEYKYDGFRTQIHKDGSNVRIFTRRLEDVTEQFPELKKAVLENVNAKECILDGEAVGYNSKTEKYVPFQVISQRIKRKYDIEKIAKKYPVELNIFDIISLDGETMLNQDFVKRRELLEKIIDLVPKHIVLAKQLITDNKEKAQEFFDEALKKGEEGLMVKSLTGIYKPGARIGYGVKLKTIMEPLDLVIVAAEYGEGKRSGYLTSFYLACDDNGVLKQIGKVSTGLKELEEEGVTFAQMTKLLEPLIIKSEGKYVELEPEIVIEVGYEEIQKSVNYNSGYALRFPRFRRLRADEKSVNDINSIEDVEHLYKIQRGRNNG